MDDVLWEGNEETNQRKYLGHTIYDKIISYANSQVLLENSENELQRNV
jgi:hypothetical protein